MSPLTFFIENLTLRAWWLSIWPRLVLSRLRRGRGTARCYVIERSRLAMLMARASGWLAGASVENLAFELVEIHDAAGLLVRLRITFQDLAEVQQIALEDPAFKELLEKGLLPDRLSVYLSKSIAAGHPAHRSSIWRAVLLVHVSAWKIMQDGGDKAAAVLFLERRPWIQAICRYASKYEISTIPVAPPLNVSRTVLRWLPVEVISVLRIVRYGSSWDRIRSMTRGASSNGLPPSSGNLSSTAAAMSPMVAVDSYGQLNLDHPEYHSDLFFWQESSLPGEDIILTFKIAMLPVDEQKWAELQKHGISAVALHPGAATVPAVPVFLPRRRKAGRQSNKLSAKLNLSQASWLRQQVANYQELRAYWVDLATAYGIKVFVTWFKYDAAHCAIADALQSVGGVTAVYQRAFESLPSVETTTAADIVFGISQGVSEIERRSNSIIPYHVTTGYLGDHRAALLRSGAKAVRGRLLEAGARRILAFTDESSADDPRWHTGHSFMRENYAFLLEKMLTEPWLGLVLKPKAPGSLRRRLGPVADILKEAEATGRCHVYEGGIVQGLHPPAEAALASDIAIHGHLCAATAGLEAALAGVPTLLLDREGWAASPLYDLGVGRVVFTDWQSLWEACQAHWSDSPKTTGFGDWSPMLDELDPFRDGRAGQRMGTYIKWLLDGFREGLDREATMAQAAERYCSAWGYDKITSVNSPPRHQHPKPPTVDGQGGQDLLSTSRISIGS